MGSVRIPSSTYRVQFNAGFRFADALRLVRYLYDLGISDMYASPILKARRGSTHGYDVVDPTQLNPEIGTPEEFESLSRGLREHGMGLLVDIVPNHMAASPENGWWYDVLEKGEASPYASFFDVNWESGKVLLPILGRPYGEALEKQEFRIGLRSGRPVLQYYEQVLPIAAGTENVEIDRALDRQHYRLAYWRKAADAINYRRFFDISDLIGLRAERDNVFRATHDYILKLVAEGKVTGLRIDHIDGLLDPKGYLDRLPEVYVVVEKILAGNEQLRPDWRAHGTTGYDFLNFLNGAFVDRAGFERLAQIYSGFTGAGKKFVEVYRERKLQVMKELFAGEVRALTSRLQRLAEDDHHARDIPAEELREAFVTVTACLPIYRTYIQDFNPSETDRAYIEDAIAAARSSKDLPAFAFLRRVLLADPSPRLQNRQSEYLDFVMAWQQFTGPAMAKGLEDTTLYVQNPLISVNTVGSDPNGPETFFGVEQFHRRNQTRQEHWPLTMNASSTHDTKRSEDTRARIDVLSELPGEWAQSLRRWSRWHPSESGPDRNEQVWIYQTMLGAWPIEPDRLKTHMVKALREAKTNSSWMDVNEDYERKVLAFIDSLYGSQQFLKDFTRLQKKLAYFGSLGSLSQLVLKIMSPGVPDVYRGTEVWDLSVADPDNRRPVDFDARIRMLEELKQRSNPKALLRKWHDGRIKMFLAWKALNFRRSHADLFLHGEYLPLRTSGERQQHVIAFLRRHENQWLVTAAARLMANLTRTGRPPLGEKVWLDTLIELPAGAPTHWTNIFTGGETASPPLKAHQAFDVLPVFAAHGEH